MNFFKIDNFVMIIYYCNRFTMIGGRKSYMLKNLKFLCW